MRAWTACSLGVCAGIDPGMAVYECQLAESANGSRLMLCAALYVSPHPCERVCDTNASAQRWKRWHTQRERERERERIKTPTHTQTPSPPTPQNNTSRHQDS